LGGVKFPPIEQRPHGVGYEVAGSVRPWGFVVIPYDLYAPRGRVAYPGMDTAEVERGQLKYTIIGRVGGAGANE
jgi:hypothetical protein